MNWRNVILLSLSQALGAGPAVVVLLGGIVGSELAPSPTWATLPVSLMVVGVALAAIPAALIMRRFGRRNGFTLSAITAAAAALLSAYAIARGDFALFCLGAVFIGTNSAFVQQYRFAAAESVDPRLAGRAVSFVLLGGVLAGFFGPELGRRAVNLLPVQYAGSFASLAAVYLAVALVMRLFQDMAPPAAAAAGGERPLRQIAAQPLFLAAVLAGAVSYAVMSFVMTATPVELHRIHTYSLDETAWVIQSHIIAMFLPSLFTGLLMERLGVWRVLAAGLACMFATVGIGLVSRELMHYWWALVLLGVGWNFLFVGATVLLTRSYQPAERFKAQAANEFAVFAAQALASLSAGAVIFQANWEMLNLINIPFLLLVAAALWWAQKKV
ncbi:MAG: MFS transporter [Chloroflexi bacterium]|nr:MFS transporter [Chloroflexota bacterium]